jgi:O-antigen ligase
MDVPLGFQRILKGGVIAIGLAFLAVLLWASGAGAEQVPLYALPLGFAVAIWAAVYARAVISGRQWAWIAFLALYIFLSEVNLRTRPIGAGGLDWQVAMKLAVWFGGTFLAMLRINAVIELLRTPIGAVTLCLMGFMMLSAAWAPDPADTLVSSILLLCTLLFAMAMVTGLSVRDILIGLSIGYCAIVLPSLAISPFAPSFAPVNADSLGEADRLRGFTTHPVSLAAICSMLMVCCASLMFYLPKRRIILAGIIVLALATLMLSQSRMAFVAVLVSGFVFWLRIRPGASWLIPIGVLAATIVTLTTASVGLENVLPKELVKLVSRSGDINELLTLTGRSSIWDFTLQQIAEAPILGHGHNSAETIFLERFLFFTVTHAHNLILQSLFSVGMVGTLFLVTILVIQLRTFLLSPDLFRDVMLLTLLVSGITETAFYTRLPGTLSIIWMFTIALGAYHVVERRRINAALWAGPGAVEEGVSLTGGFGADEASHNVSRPGGKRLSESLAG